MGIRATAIVVTTALCMGTVVAGCMVPTSGGMTDASSKGEGEAETVQGILASYAQFACGYVEGDGGLSRDEAEELAQCLMSRPDGCLAERSYICSQGMTRLARRARHFRTRDIVGEEGFYTLSGGQDVLVRPGSLTVVTIGGATSSAYYLQVDSVSCETEDDGCYPIEPVSAAREAMRALRAYVLAGCERDVYVWQDSSLGDAGTEHIVQCLSSDLSKGSDLAARRSCIVANGFECTDPFWRVASRFTDFLVRGVESSKFLIGGRRSYSFGGLGADAREMVVLPGSSTRINASGHSKVYYLRSDRVSCWGDGCIAIGD